MSIIQFKNIKDNDVHILGGKASSLINLIKEGFNVPDGFVISTDIFNEFLKHNNIKDKIDNLVSKIKVEDIKEIENISFQIENLFSRAVIPTNIAKEILHTFNILEFPYVAVRSSANIEDGFTNAWAGQFNTYLNTTDVNLLDNIKKCWQSLYLPKALMYRARNNMINTDILVAVIIQVMVDSEVSGIGFSINPANNDNNNIIIESGFGLGEAIVSGLITPDTYIVNKENFNIIKKINYQSKTISRLGMQTISKLKGLKQKLNDHQILEVAKSIIKIEEIYKYPIDIEFAYRKDKLYLLQARPITTHLGNYNNLSTKIDKELLEYIESQEWGSFKNTKRPLLFASMWAHGIRRPIKTIVDKLYVEDIEVNTVLDRPLRCFNVSKGNYPKIILTDPNLILKYIEDDYNTLTKAQIIIDLISLAMNNNNHEDVLSYSIQFINLYDEISFYECYINGLLQILYNNKNAFENANSIIEIANRWRNDESLDHTSGIFIPVAQFLLNRRMLHIQGNEIAKYFHINEFIKMLKCELSDEDIIDIVESRKKHGYILLNLNLPKYQNIVLDIKSGTKEIEDFVFSAHRNVTKERFNGFELVGKSTYESNEVIRGECVVVHQEEDLSCELNLKEKILVTTMTTPNFIPYISDVKGIITDNGGIICHAAIISREYNIPCIIGTEAATAIYKSGDFVEMNIKDETIIKI